MKLAWRNVQRKQTQELQTTQAIIKHKINPITKNKHACIHIMKKSRKEMGHGGTKHSKEYSKQEQRLNE